MLLLRAWIFNHIYSMLTARPPASSAQVTFFCAIPGRFTVRWLRRWIQFIVSRVHKMNAWEAQNNGVWSYLPTQDAGLSLPGLVYMFSLGNPELKYFMPPPPLHPGWGGRRSKVLLLLKKCFVQIFIDSKVWISQVVWRFGFKGWVVQSCAGFGQKWVSKLRWLFPLGPQGYSFHCRIYLIYLSVWMYGKCACLN